ncbi:hypothetical protein FF3_01123 [Fretibacterium fastidiosum]
MLGKVTLGSVKSITLKEIMKMSDAEMNVVCDALFNDDYNDEWFEQAGRESSRETLLTLIEKSYSLCGVVGFLDTLLHYVNSKAVTDDVFQKIIKYPSRSTRRSLMISLAHSQIAIYQLEYICSKQICTEAFCQLANIINTDSNFTITDLEHLLNNSKKMVKEVVPIEEYLMDDRISNEKKSMLKEWWKNLEHAKNIHDLL